MSTSKETNQPRERYEVPIIEVLMVNTENSILFGSDSTGGIENTEDVIWDI